MQISTRFVEFPYNSCNVPPFFYSNSAPLTHNCGGTVYAGQPLRKKKTGRPISSIYEFTVRFQRNENSKPNILVLLLLFSCGIREVNRLNLWIWAELAL